MNHPADLLKGTLPPNGNNAAVEPTNTADTSTVELEELQEARDSVGNLPGLLVNGPAPDLGGSLQQQQWPSSRGIQFGGVDVQTFETPPPLSEEHSHFLLQKSLPQIPVANVELEIRVSRVSSPCHPGGACSTSCRKKSC